MGCSVTLCSSHIEKVYFGPVVKSFSDLADVSCTSSNLKSSNFTDSGSQEADGLRELLHSFFILLRINLLTGYICSAASQSKTVSFRIAVSLISRPSTSTINTELVSEFL